MLQRPVIKLKQVVNKSAKKFLNNLTFNFHKMNKKILFLTNNYPAPDWRRLWKKAASLSADGYEVRIICPAGAHKPGARKFKGITIRYFKKDYWHENLNETENATQSAQLDKELSRQEMIRKELSRQGLLSRQERMEQGASVRSWMVKEFFEFLKVAFWSGWTMLSWRPKVVHVVNPNDSLGILGMMFKLLGVRFVYEVNESFPQKFVQEQLGNKRTKLRLVNFLKSLEKKVLKSAHLVIVPDFKQKARVARLMGARKNVLITVEPLPDLKDFYQPYLNRDFKRGFPHLALYSGSLKVERGIIKLLRAIDFIVNKTGRRDILFVLAGDGPDVELIKSFAAQKNILRNMYFTGWLKQEKLLSYLAVADMGLMPEPIKIGRPVLRDSVLEFLAMGKPVVSFDTKGRESRIGKAGAFVDDSNEITFAREIVRIIDNKERSLAMGEIGKVRVERDLNWLKSEIKLLSAYERLTEPESLVKAGRLAGRAA